MSYTKEEAIEFAKLIPIDAEYYASPQNPQNVQFELGNDTYDVDLSEINGDRFEVVIKENEVQIIDFLTTSTVRVTFSHYGYPNTWRTWGVYRNLYNNVYDFQASGDLRRELETPSDYAGPFREDDGHTYQDVFDFAIALFDLTDGLPVPEVGTLDAKFDQLNGLFTGFINEFANEFHKLSARVSDLEDLHPEDKR